MGGASKAGMSGQPSSRNIDQQVKVNSPQSCIVEGGRDTSRGRTGPGHGQC